VADLREITLSTATKVSNDCLHTRYRSKFTTASCHFPATALFEMFQLFSSLIGIIVHICNTFLNFIFMLLLVFLARDSMLSALYAIARLSVCHTGGSVEKG